MRQTFALLLFIFSVSHLLACDVPGRVKSPFEACKDVLIVEKGAYQKHLSQWNECEQECNLVAQLSDTAGITALDPLHEGSKYIALAGRVADKVSENLEKSRKYADCSALCFSGHTACPASLSVTNKEVQCSERKKEIIEGMKVQARKLRIEMALANENHGLFNVNVYNVLSLKPQQFINKKLLPFEFGTPNPLGKLDLSSRELKEAERRLVAERKKLEEEAKSKNVQHYDSWMSSKLMQNFDEHKERYRKLIYEEAPIFSVIEPPNNWNETDPVWDNKQLATAFKKLSQNAAITMNKVRASKEKGKLEFSRANGEVVVHSLAKWVSSDAPDLLYFLSMNRQVEEVLKADPSSCAIATTMAQRLSSKDMQNRAIVGTMSMAVGPVTTKLVAGAAGTFIAAYSGLAIGAVYLGENYQQYSARKEEAGSSSGLSSQEGTSLGSSKRISRALGDVQFSAALLPMDVNLVKTIFLHINQIKGTAAPLGSQEKVVNEWLVSLTEKMLKEKKLSEADKAFLYSEEGGKVFAELMKTGSAGTSNLDKVIESALISAARTRTP